MIVDFFKEVKRSVTAQCFASLPPLRDCLCHRNNMDGIIRMDHAVCNNERVQVLTPLHLAGEELNMDRQLLLVGHSPAK